MKLFEIIITILGSSAFTGVITHLATRSKYKVETETVEFNLTEKITSFYKKELIEMITKLDSIKIQMEQLEMQLENLSLDNCQNTDCKNRNTKRKQIMQKYENIL